MIKVTKAHYELFKKECKKWINRFQLNNWEIHFEHTALRNDVRAELAWRIDGYVCWIKLNTEWESMIPNAKNIKWSAKHEVGHLLTCRVGAQARTRFLSETELSEALEELVQQLCNIIK